MTDRELALVERALAVIASVEGNDNHTVAAAAYDAAGNIFTGVNVYHFTGGPCAEPVVMGQAAAARHARLPLITMVAVGNNGRGVIPPCGRCRQMLLDYYPDARVIVQAESGLAVVPISDLLPYAYGRSLTGGRVLAMPEGSLDAVRRGTKRTTIRLDDPAATPGPVRLLFEHDDDTTTLDAIITDVVSKVAADLDDADAARDGFSDRWALLNALQSYYPDLEMSSEVAIVHFHAEG